MLQVNDVEKRILENIRGDVHPSFQKKMLQRDVQMLCEANTQSIVKV